MSTYACSLYRPVKKSDLLDLGFEILFNEEAGRNYMRIKSEKLGYLAEWDKLSNNVMGRDSSVPDYYYLYLGAWINRKGGDAMWHFERYNTNYPALDYLLEGLHNKGYKLQVEGERYNNHYNERLKEIVEKHKSIEK